MKITLEHDWIKLLFVLLLADLAFILMHILYVLDYFTDPLLSVGRESGYAEVYQYIKEFWIAVLLLVLAINSRNVAYCAWCMLFTYFLLDDSLQIHERGGAFLVERLSLVPMFQLRAQDYGELIVTLVAATVIFSGIALSYFFSCPVLRKISKNLFFMVLLLVFFGVVVDMLHAAIEWRRGLFELAEDGGEMLIMSLIVGYVFSLRMDRK